MEQSPHAESGAHFYTNRQAASLVVLSCLTAVAVPALAWCGKSGHLARESVAVPVGIVGVLIVTLFKHLPLSDHEPRDMPLRDRFISALCALGARETAAKACYRALITIPALCLIAVVVLPFGS
jgi:hypothetical protein